MDSSLPLTVHAAATSFGDFCLEDATSRSRRWAADSFCSLRSLALRLCRAASFSSWVSSSNGSDGFDEDNRRCCKLEEVVCRDANRAQSWADGIGLDEVANVARRIGFENIVSGYRG